MRVVVGGLVVTERTPPTARIPGRHAPLERPSVWPTVLGVIAIVLGVLAVLGGLVGMIIIPVLGWLASSIPGDAVAAFRGMIEWRGALLVLYGGYVVLGALLAWGGMELTRREARGVTLLRWWAWLKILYAVASVPVTAGMQIAQLEGVREAASGDLPLSDDVMTIMAIGGAVLGALWYAVLPVFVLVWFGRGRIRQEVSDWSAEGKRAMT